ncbi:uncharacterized protein LOC110189751 [Drosophila serrata]|uniref:uncharacterized protein LOC110189751 n=1 Tax=Drosophila serrata TaxID=7274 RepID=UPI000A1D0303|nr:uncharacterized protein LOC110189751 [Drosophila serrata]
MDLKKIEENPVEMLNSKKVKIPIEENSVPATIEGSLGGAKDEPKESTEKPLALMQETITQGKKAQGAESDVDVKPIGDTSVKIKEEMDPEAVVEESLGGAKDEPKKSTEKPRDLMQETITQGKKTKEADSDIDIESIADISAKIEKEEEPEAIVEKSVAATVEDSLGGVKEEPKKSIENTRGLMQETITQGKKAKEADSDIDIESISGTSKSENANQSAQSANKEAAMTSEKKAANEGRPTRWKRVLQSSGSHFDQEKEKQHFKKRKIHPKDEAGGTKQLEHVTKGVESKINQLPKTVSEPGYFQITRRKIITISRRELEGLAMKSMVDEKKAKCDAANIRKLWVDTKNKKATYDRKVSEMLKGISELQKGDTKVVARGAPSRPYQATVQDVASTSGSKLSASSGISPKSQLVFRPIALYPVPKCVTKVRPAPSVHNSSAGGSKVGSLGPKRNSIAPLGEAIENAIKLMNKKSGVEADPPKGSTNANPLLGQAATDAVKETAKLKVEGPKAL